MPAACCSIVPDNLDWEQVAEMLLAAIAYRAIVNANIVPGETVILNACTGATGATAIKIAALWDPGMIIVTGRNEKKLEKVKSWAPNIIQTISSVKENVQARITELTEGKGANVLIDFTPTGGNMKVVEQCLASLNNCARAIFVGGTMEQFQVSYGLFMHTGLMLTGVLGIRPDDIETVMMLMSRGKLNFDGLITHRFPLSKSNEAFEVFEKKIDNAMGVIVLPQE